MTPTLLIVYRDELKDQQYAVSTIARKLSCVRQALGCVHAEGLIESNPAATVKTFKVLDVSPRHALDNATVRALLVQPDPSTVKGARGYALLALLLYLGLRRSEVVRLTCGQIGDERGHKTVRIAEKGGKVRLLPLPPQVMEAIRNYLQRDGRPDALISDLAAHLFLPIKNPRYGALDKPLSADELWQMVKQYACVAGLDPLDVHTLRLPCWQSRSIAVLRYGECKRWRGLAIRRRRHVTMAGAVIWMTPLSVASTIDNGSTVYELRIAFQSITSCRSATAAGRVSGGAALACPCA